MLEPLDVARRIAAVKRHLEPFAVLGDTTRLGRRMGRKNVRTDDPVERNKLLEVVVPC